MMISSKVGRIPFLVLLLTIFLLHTVPVEAIQPKAKNPLEGAAWIGHHKGVQMADSLRYGDFPAPLFRKEFVVGKQIRKATLTITAAGYFLVRVNGNNIENNVLDPAWTNFAKRIYCSTYDLTKKIQVGNNTLGVELGNGFYNLLPLKMFGRNLRNFLPTGDPQWIAMLKIDYQDGSSQSVVSDTSWKTALGPMLKNNVYLGVLYDARRELPGWDKAGFNDSSWQHAVLMSGPGGEIQPAIAPEIHIAEKVKPVGVVRNKEMVIIDMGTNMTGLYRIKLHGNSGDTIRFRFGERLYQDGSLNPMTTVAGQVKQKGRGGPGAPDIAWQTDSYICGKNGEATFQPNFSFHTFRYIEIKGLSYLPDKEDIEALCFHADVENQNTFSCSDTLLNKIQQISRKTFLSNLISVQSDCPAREKFGYGGDLNATSETFIYNFGMKQFYKKTILDWVDAMQDSIFIDTAPYVGIKYCGISWESAYLITQYKLFQYYGDTALVKQFYQRNLEWMEKVNRLHPDGIVDKGLSDHESMYKVPVQLIGTTHYLDCARIMHRFAIINKDLPNVQKFEQLEKSLASKIVDQFWHQPVADPINRQTLFSTLIYYNLIPDNELAAGVDSLLKAVKSEPSGHLTTGIFGTKYILEALSKTGHVEEVYRIVKSDLYPGWGYMVKQGATTLWETWKESDNVYSNCHPMFGTVSEWYFRWLAGIQPMEGTPGFQNFAVCPSFPKGLYAVHALYHAPNGDIKVDWKHAVQGEIDLYLTIPKGCQSRFCPHEKNPGLWVITNVATGKIVRYDGSSAGLLLSEGRYACHSLQGTGL